MNINKYNNIKKYLFSNFDNKNNIYVRLFR